MTKTYSSKSNALRAYLAANPDCGLERSELAEYLVQDGTGWRVEYQPDADEPDDVVTCDECGHELASPNSDCHQEGCPANPESEDMEAEHDVESEVPVRPIQPIKGTGAYKDVPLRRRSTDGGAVSWAWSVFDAMPAGSTRKDCIAEAVRQGIAFYTARTQYQKWLRRDLDKKEG